jgi:hypothetical protein
MDLVTSGGKKLDLKFRCKYSGNRGHSICCIKLSNLTME